MSANGVPCVSGANTSFTNARIALRSHNWQTKNFVPKRWGHDIPVSRDFWATRFLFLFECTSAKLMDLEMEQRYRPTFVKSEFLKGIICSWHLLPYRGAPTTLQDISVSSGDLQNLLIFNMCV
jgi:hypothetical protein